MMDLHPDIDGLTAASLTTPGARVVRHEDAIRLIILEAAACGETVYMCYRTVAHIRYAFSILSRSERLSRAVRKCHLSKYMIEFKSGGVARFIYDDGAQWMGVKPESLFFVR